MKTHPLPPCLSEPDCVENTAFTRDVREPAEAVTHPLVSESRAQRVLSAAMRGLPARAGAALRAGEPAWSRLHAVPGDALVRACDDRAWPVHSGRPVVVRAVLIGAALLLAGVFASARAFARQSERLFGAALVTALAAAFAVVTLGGRPHPRLQPIGPDPDCRPLPTRDATVEALAQTDNDNDAGALLRACR